MNARNLTVAAFPISYRRKMIAAYPVIARMTADEAYLATVAERDEAFGRVLAARNLRVTHEMFLASLSARANA